MPKQEKCPDCGTMMRRCHQSYYKVPIGWVCQVCNAQEKRAFYTDSQLEVLKKE
jgi:rubredoxin